MPLSQNDRIAFSLAIVQADATIAGIQNAQNALNAKIASLESLDTANDGLFSPVNGLITAYQIELQNLDGNGRTSITEQNLIDSANHILGNVFFPNNTQASVPSLAPTNVWSKVNPFALGFAIGKNYSEAFTPVSSESAQMTAINAIITSATGMYTDTELTTGIDMAMDGAIVTIKNNMVTAVTALQATANAELTALNSITDTNATRAAQNVTAISNLNTFLSALSSWQAQPDFAPMPGPSKLHSTQLAALQAAFTVRNTFIPTRITQLDTNLGSITQSLTDGTITASSGLYGQRYSFLNLRVNALSGSLSQILSLQGAVNAQTQMIANIISTVAIYKTLLSVGLFSAAGNGTAVIHTADASLFSPGDFVYIYSEQQVELTRGIKSINGNAITLNDIVPSKYTTSNNGRVYKDLT
jgi:hypothetical protein